MKPKSKDTPAITPELKARREKARLKKQKQRALDDDSAFEKALKVLEKTAETNPALERVMLAGMGELMSRYLPIPPVKPPFAYVGSKSRYAHLIIKRLEDSIKEVRDTLVYCEPFAGSLASFLAVADTLKAKGIRRVILNDFNPHLINFYRMAEAHPDLLIEEINSIEERFIESFPIEYSLKMGATIPHEDRPALEDNVHAFFKDHRTALQHDESLNNIQRAGLIYFVLQHGFNGLYTESQKGNIGTAFGWKKKRIFLNEITEKIYGLHFVFNSFQTEFTNKHFRDLDWLQDTFFYLDPPYIESGKDYLACGFGLDEQKELLESVQASGAPFLYSNNNHVFLRDLLDESVTVETFARKNIVAGSGEARSDDKEELLAGRTSAWPFNLQNGKWLEIPLKAMTKER
ncbi:MAG: DNA adenine methylase [Sideroxydans sp.]|nr:DNA adenine methylase [Sideroxydans sp.]